MVTVITAGSARATEFQAAASDGQPPPPLVLERYAGIVEGRHRGDFWQIVCALPCASDVADGFSYRLRAPDLDLEPLRLAALEPQRLTVRAPHYKSHLPVILGATLLGGSILGGVGAGAYGAYTNNQTTQTLDGALVLLAITGAVVGFAFVLAGATDEGDIQLAN